MNTTTECVYWAGVAEVVPRYGNNLLEGAEGAYVGVIGMASSAPEFFSKANAAFAAMDFDMLDLADVGSIRSVEDWTNADDGLRMKLASLSTSNPIEFGTFQCFSD